MRTHLPVEDKRPELWTAFAGDSMELERLHAERGPPAKFVGVSCSESREIAESRSAGNKTGSGLAVVLRGAGAEERKRCEKEKTLSLHDALIMHFTSKHREEDRRRRGRAGNDRLKWAGRTYCFPLGIQSFEQSWSRERRRSSSAGQMEEVIALTIPHPHSP